MHKDVAITIAAAGLPEVPGFERQEDEITHAPYY